MKKTELIQELLDKYGYEKEDLVDKEGKPFTNAKLKSLLEAEEKEAEQAEVDANRVLVKETVKIKDDDKIRVMSGSSGGVIYRSEISRKVWKFKRFGQMENMPYEELVSIQNRFPIFFKEGWIIVLDKTLQDEFGLTEMYKNILTPDNIDTIFDKSLEDLEVFVNNLPEGMKNTFINKTQELYKTGDMNMKVVRLIESKFGFSLEDNSPVNDVALNGNLGNNKVIYVDKK